MKRNLDVCSKCSHTIAMTHGGVCSCDVPIESRVVMLDYRTLSHYGIKDTVVLTFRINREVPESCCRRMEHLVMEQSL